MAADNSFGLSFAPFSGGPGVNNQNPDLSPIQEAVQILSLRRPTLTGTSPVPNALYNGPGLQGGPDLSALLQTILGLAGGAYHQPRLPRETLPGGPAGGVPPVSTPPMPAPPMSLPGPHIDPNQGGPMTGTAGSASGTGGPAPVLSPGPVLQQPRMPSRYA